MTTYVLQDGLVIVREGNRVVLPRDDRLLLDVLVHCHDNAVVAHSGAVRTFLALSQRFLCKGMRSTVDENIRTCETCSRNKSGDRRRGLMQPLPIPIASWTDISMGFVTGLLLSNGFDAIYVVVRRLSKRARYLPTRKAATASDVVLLFFNNVAVIHGTPRSIVSDRDPKFLSDFWQEMARIMRIKLKMTVSHRAQADGQSERQIRTLEDALRCSVSHYGDDWPRRLPCIEFAHATGINMSTGRSPMEVDTLQKSNPSLLGDNGAVIICDTRNAAIDAARQHLIQAQERQRRYYNRARQDVHFKVGDFVSVKAGLLNINRLGRPDYDPERDPTVNKLLPKWLGSFPIEKALGPTTYRLVLPDVLKAHRSFNVDQINVKMWSEIFTGVTLDEPYWIETECTTG